MLLGILIGREIVFVIRFLSEGNYIPMPARSEHWRATSHNLLRVVFQAHDPAPTDIEQVADL